MSRYYTFTVPAEWDIANCELVAFVSEYQRGIHQARAVEADGGLTTAVEATPAMNEVRAPYPVPAKDHVFIPLVKGEEGAVIRLMDTAGRPVLETVWTSGLGELDVARLENGSYYFTIIGKDSQRTGRIVVRH